MSEEISDLKARLMVAQKAAANASRAGNQADLKQRMQEAKDIEATI